MTKSTSEKHLTLLLSEEVLLQKIAELALQLNKDYEGKELTLVMILKGSLCFAADLIRELRIPFCVEMIQCKSYGGRGMQRGDLCILGEDQLHLQDKDVLVIEDIFDTGATLQGIYASFLKMKPASLKSAVLLSKKMERTTSLVPDYTLFAIENRFVVGYGLDYKEHYRGLRGIYVLTPP